MFVKVFKRIHDSSIANDHIVRLVFMDFLILADRDGVVDMTLEAFSRRTNVPLEIVKVAVEKLLLPDEESNTPDHGGRRLLPLTDEKPWGWKIVNYEKYRNIRNSDDLREQTRLRVRKHRALKAAEQNGHPETDNRFAEFWRVYPKKQSKDDAVKAWRKVKPEEVDVILKDVCDRAVSDQWRKDSGQYIPMPSTYLNGRRWTDETKEPLFTPKPRGAQPNI